MKTFRNVNNGFNEFVRGFKNGEIPTFRTQTRNGFVMQCDGPIMWQFTRPWERVLFNRARDCNPFFHLYEAMWMLAGRSSVENLAYYCSNMKQFSDDGVTFWGAYGGRWRHWFTIDQLHYLIQHLKEKPDSRRAVLQMWDGEKDLMKARFSEPEPKDLPCNMSCCFSIDDMNRLHMTIFNRSNDLIWGAMGANAVHFSFLLEYMANKLGLDIGYMVTVSNNLHAYQWNWNPDEWLNDTSFNVYEDVDGVRLMPFTQTPAEVEALDDDIQWFVTHPLDGGGLVNYFLRHVGTPMMRAFKLHKERDYEKALEECERIVADDWQYAAANWIIKRRNAWRDR